MKPALLGRYGLRPPHPSSAIERAQAGQIYFGDQAGKWFRFKSALTHTSKQQPRLLGVEVRALLELSI